jgi:hypothetical protein
MKIERALKKINQDVLMGIVIGIMVVILACFLGVCFAPRKGLLEGMENKTKESSSDSDSDSDSDSKDILVKKLKHQNYVATTTSMNSACSLQNNQNSCNKEFYVHNGNNYPCSWDVTNKRCNLDFDKASFSNWTSINNSPKTNALTPASTSSSTSSSPSSSTSSSSSNSFSM